MQFLHLFIFGKNVCFCNCFVCFGYVLLFLFTLGAYKEKKKYQEKEKSAWVSELFEFSMPSLGIVCEANIYKPLA